MGYMVRAGSEWKHRVDIVVLTVMPVELEAARRALQIDDASRKKEADGTVYLRGTVRSELAGREYAIALTCIGGAGNPGARPQPPERSRGITRGPCSSWASLPGFATTSRSARLSCPIAWWPTSLRRLSARQAARRSRRVPRSIGRPTR